MEFNKNRRSGMCEKDDNSIQGLGFRDSVKSFPPMVVPMGLGLLQRRILETPKGTSELYGS